MTKNDDKSTPNPDDRVCEKCGTRLPFDAPKGICPTCLLNVGFESAGDLEDAATLIAETQTNEAAAPSPHLNAESNSLREGQQFGNYRIGQLLGKGGMGEVYEAEEIESGRRVALKVLIQKLDSAETRQRFLREGRMAAAVNHPNSVYVYGTEEVEGTPVISMELVVGGTLKQIVRDKGPLPITEAVDTILQVVAGLEAAHGLGVLHRDIKPSNCFVENDGSVKVGDYGLSVSTLSRDQTQLTVTGAVMGTPAFCSPEQLRGDELDVRSDIYSVGVTLFYLLTGKVPFDSQNMVQLLATVLEKKAPSAAELRPEIPDGLARTVLKCLAKQPQERFRDYHELREALARFGSTAPVPASLGMRFLAGAVDNILIGSFTVLPMYWWTDNSGGRMNLETYASTGFVFMYVLTTVLHLAYFAVPEGIWGASAGKALCGLRLVGADRGIAGLKRASVRVLIFAMVPAIPSMIYMLFDPVAAITGQGGAFTVIVNSFPLLLLILLFLTARRRNGFAAIHDLASRTRVVVKTSIARRETMTVAEEAPPEIELETKLGPYHALASLSVDGDEELLLGYDTRLLRKVWIRKLPAGAAPVSQERQALSRAGRLHWINGRRNADEAWDAYEATPGKPLLNLLNVRQSWKVVRHWLEDLGAELASGKKNGSPAPVLALDHVWITSDGRARLLDFSAPGIDPTPQPVGGTIPTPGRWKASATSRRLKMWILIGSLVGVVGLAALGAMLGAMSIALLTLMVAVVVVVMGCLNFELDSKIPAPNTSDQNEAPELSFLKQTAMSALEGRVVSTEESRDRQVEAPMPVYGRALVAGIPSQGGISSMLDDLKSEEHRPSAVSRVRRLAAVFCCAFLPVAILIIQFSIIVTTTNWVDKNPELARLRACLSRYRQLDRQSRELKPWEAQHLEAFPIYIAGTFKESIEDREIWRDKINEGMVRRKRLDTARQILAEHPEPSPAELRVATSALQSFLQRIDREGPWVLDLGFSVSTAVKFLALVTLGSVALPSILGALHFRGGLVMRILGFAVVSRRGAQASGFRMFCRSLLAWSPLFLTLFFIGSERFVAGAIVLAAFFTAAVVGAWFSPERGLHDRLSGTWLVPK